jgi:hypothetical protein
MQERDLFNESETTRTISLNCPYCRQSAEYKLRWVMREKKARPARGLDADEKRRFDKAQSYMVLRDDAVQCANNRCRKRFEISGVKTVVLL